MLAAGQQSVGAFEIPIRPVIVSIIMRTSLPIHLLFTITLELEY
jgi:hypothetical protein